MPYFETARSLMVAQAEYSSTDPDLCATTRQVGAIYLRIGDHGRAEDAFREAVGLCAAPGVEREEAALAAAGLAEALHWQARYQGARDIAQSALSDLAGSISAESRIVLLQTIAYAAWSQGERSDAIAASELLKLAVSDVGMFDGLLEAYYRIAYTEMHAGSHWEAARWLLRMESVSKTSNDDRGLARCYHAMGDLYRDLRANPGEAASFFEKSLSYAERVGDVHLLFSGHAEAAQTHLLSGSDIQVADEHAAKADAWAHRMLAGGRAFGNAARHFEDIADAYSLRGSTDTTATLLWRALELRPRRLDLLRMLRKLELHYRSQGQLYLFQAEADARQKNLIDESGNRMQRVFLAPVGLRDNPLARRVCVLSNGSLVAGWRWEDPAGTADLSVGSAGRVVTVSVPFGERVHNQPQSAARVVSDAPHTFVFEASLHSDCGNARGCGGILIWVSESAFLAFGKPVGEVPDMRLEAGTSSGLLALGRGILTGNRVLLRFECNKGSVRALCAARKDKWLECGTWDFPNDLRASVGIYGCANHDVSLSVSEFSDISLYLPEVSTCE